MSVDSFFSQLNPLVAGLLRLPVLHWLASGGLMLITVTGHRSGRRYSFPVGYQLAEGGKTVFVLVSEARTKQWWRNYRERRPVEMRLRGRLRRGQAQLVEPHTDLFKKRVEITLRRVPGMHRVFRVADYDRAAGLTADQIAQLADEIAMLRIELAQPSDAAG